MYARNPKARIPNATTPIATRNLSCFCFPAVLEVVRDFVAPISYPGSLLAAGVVLSFSAKNKIIEVVIHEAISRVHAVTSVI